MDAPLTDDFIRSGIHPGKLRVPSPADRLVVRPRLIHLVTEGLTEGHVVVSAPAGSGKTQLLGAWADTCPVPGNVAWVNLDEGDTEPARFVRYCVAALQSTPAGARALDGLGTVVPLSSLRESYVMALTDALARCPEEVWLVLDDFQAVIGSESERLVRRIMGYTGERLRLVLLTRVRPSVGQAKLRLEGRLHELGARDLAFTLDETADLLDVQGVRLPPTALQAVQTYTEGWAAALRVLAPSLRNAPDPDDLVARLHSADAFVVDYLMAEVFDRQPPETQQLLLRAATVDPVCGDLVDALTDGVGGAAALEDLHRTNVFLDRVDRYDGRCAWYHWHPMFAEMLRTRLADIDSRLGRALHRTAARWFSDRGCPVEAVHHFVASGDDASAAAVLGEHWLDLVTAGEGPVLRLLLDLFDDSWRTADPELLVIYSFLHLQERELERARRCAVQATVLAAHLAPGRRLAVEAVAAAVRLYTATMTGREGDDHPYAAALSVLEQLSTEDMLLTAAERRRRAQLLFHIGAFEVALWLYDEPRQHLGDAMAEAVELGMPDLELRCRAQLSLLDFFTGRLEAAGAAATEVLDAVETRGWHSHHSLEAALVVLGGIDLVRGDVGAGLERLAAARSIVHPVDQVMKFRVELFHLAGLCSTGRAADARTQLAECAELVDPGRSPGWMCVWLAIAQAEVLAAEGQHEAALEAVESVAAEAAAAPAATSHWRTFYARQLLRSGNASEARAVIAPVTTQERRWLVDVLAYVVDSVAAERLGMHAECMDALAAALTAASHERIVLPFLGSGPQVRRLLVEILEHGTTHEAWVLDLLSLSSPGRSSYPSPVRARLSEPLTAREIQVLRVLQTPASGEEVARRLFISVNTLRTHLKHINRKLQTTSRREAVARGRQLGLV